MSAIGDVLHATPVAEAIKNAYPDVKIGWAVHPHCVGILAGNPFIDQIHLIPRKNFLRQLPAIRQEFSKHKYDVAIDFQGLLKSGLVSFLSGAKKRIGPVEAKEGAGIFYHQKVLRDIKGTHVVDGYLQMLSAIGIESLAHRPKMRVHVLESDQTFADGLLYGLGLTGAQFIVLNPGAGHVSKQWSPKKFAELSLMLNQPCVVTGGPSDLALAEAICNLNPKVHNLVGKTNLNQLAGILSRAAVFVGGDTGPMHIAQAVNCSVVALFGPTNPNILGPKGPNDQIVSALSNYEGIGTWIDDVAKGDMNQISVEDVYEAVVQTIRTRP